MRFNLANGQAQRAAKGNSAALCGLQIPAFAGKNRFGHFAVRHHLKPAFNAPRLANAGYFNGIFGQGVRLKDGLQIN